MSAERNVRLLLDHGANPNSRDLLGGTPLHAARTVRIVDLLINYGANQYLGISSEDGTGRPKIALEVMEEYNDAAARVLLDKCIHTNDQDLTSKNLILIYDLKPFKYVAPCPSRGEMTLITRIMEGGDLRDLMKHPLSDIYIHLKYCLFRPLFLLNLFCFSLFVSFLTILALLSTYNAANCERFNTVDRLTSELATTNCMI